MIDTRCRALAPMPSGMYRCTEETGDGHTEHRFNYYRKLTPEEQQKLFPPDPDLKASA